MTEHPFVCLVCGETSRTRASLEAHWRSTLHHPRATRLQAIDRARASVSPVPLPELDERRVRREMDGAD